MEWIKVEDRLPSERGYVLVYLNNGEIRVGYPHLGKMEIACSYCAEGTHISHWAHLPKGPDELDKH